MASMPEPGVQAPAAGATTRSLRFRQTATVLLLFGGYGALYFCRADLSVATPLLAEELDRVGGELTLTALPHHRTCGSASGGST